jgi:hypothetical protein
MSQPTKYARTFSCPSCGGSLEVKAPGHTVTLACQYCSSLIDVNTPEYKVIRAQKDARKPTLPLGTRLELEGHEWEVIGMQIKEDIQWKYDWEELLLYNPRYGFCWLSHYQGHWLLNTPVHAQFDLDPSSYRQRWDGREYRIYHRGRCRTTYVLGEFYWRAKVGDEYSFADFIAPPYNLNVESNDQEVAWTLGRYLPQEELKAALRNQKDLKLPRPKGVAPTQPNPHKRDVRWMTWTYILALFALIAIQIISAKRARNEEAFAHYLELFMQKPAPFANGQDTTRLYISPTFEIKGEVDNVEIQTDLRNLSNSWVEVYYSLVNEETGEEFVVTEPLEYYSGYDSDGSWTEGSTNATTLLNGVPGGEYHIEVQVLMESSKPPTAVHLRVMRGVLPYTNIFLFFLFLLILPVVTRIRSHLFERKRWAESDHNPYS